MTPETWLTVYKGMLYLGTFLVAIATVGTSIYSARIEHAKDRKIDDLLAGTKQLQEGNAELLKSVAKYQIDLEAKQTEIDTLKGEVQKASTGQYSAWDFNGVRREGKAGAINTIAGDEVEVFQRIVQLEKEGKHAEIVTITTEQIAKTPDWLTPYFARGVAYANLGRLEWAISDLEYVVKHSAGDPEYSGAPDALAKVRMERGR